ncbi:hypothetical protein [Coleofasciculus sp. G1-WW12-02]
MELEFKGNTRIHLIGFELDSPCCLFPVNLIVPEVSRHNLRFGGEMNRAL